jgi:hypothetical protein
MFEALKMFSVAKCAAGQSIAVRPSAGRAAFDSAEIALKCSSVASYPDRCFDFCFLPWYWVIPLPLVLGLVLGAQKLHKQGGCCPAVAAGSTLKGVSTTKGVDRRRILLLVVVVLLLLLLLLLLLK